MRIQLLPALIVSGVLLIAPLLAIAAETSEIHFQNETTLTLNGVSGAGANQSTLTQNHAYENTLNLNMHSDTLYMNLGGIVTDDRTADPKTVSLSNFQIRKTMGNSVLNLGDTFESCSQYGLGSSLKGASFHYQKTGTKSPELTLVGGYAYPQWANFSADQDVKTIRRTAYGFNLKQDLSETWMAGLHFLKTNDSDRINTTDPLYNGSIYSVYWAYKPFDGLAVTGESAFSQTSESPSDGVTDQRYSGSAHKVAFAGEGGPYRVNLDYERVSPNFLSVLGAATADREKVKFKLREKLTTDTSVTYGLLWYHDNLDGQQVCTTDHYKPEITWVKRRLFGKKSASGDVSYKLDYASGGGQKTTDHFLDFGYRDRFGRIDSDTKLGFVSYSTNGGVRKSNEFTLNTSFSSRYTIGNYTWKPIVELGTWHSRDELTDQNDRTWEAAVGSGLDIPNLNIVSSFKVGCHQLLQTVGDNTRRTFARVDINHRLNAKEGTVERSLFLRWYLNDYNCTDNTKIFTENSLVAGMDFRY